MQGSEATVCPRFGVSFALYTLSGNGQRQDLYGYFWWDPIITVA